MSIITKELIWNYQDERGTSDEDMYDLLIDFIEDTDQQRALKTYIESVPKEKEKNV